MDGHPQASLKNKVLQKSFKIFLSSLGFCSTAFFSDINQLHTLQFFQAVKYRQA